MADFVVPSDRALKLSGEFDYLNESGSTFYYGEHATVSASSNLGSVTVGNSLSRRQPSWVVSAGQSNLKQQQPAIVPTATASNAPAGGTGATAGAYDTAAHRDAAITALNNVIADVDSIRQFLKGKR